MFSRVALRALINVTRPLRATPKTGTLRSHSGIFDPPAWKTATQPRRAFDADYAGGRHFSSGNPVPGQRLTHTMDGVPLKAEYVVGRQAVGAGDVPLSPERQLDLARRLGVDVRAVTAKEIGKDSGQYVVKPGTAGSNRSILYRSDLSDPAKQRVIAHEKGHVLDTFDAIPRQGVPIAGLKKELAVVYNDLNNPHLHGKHIWKTAKPVTPETFGYTGAMAEREYMAEAIRAYMRDPNYLKTVAPKTAKAIRDHVNTNPRIASVIQFNSLAPLVAAGGVGATVLAGRSRTADAAVSADAVRRDAQPVAVRTYTRTYTTGPKAGSTETVVRKL